MFLYLPFHRVLVSQSLKEVSSWFLQMLKVSVRNVQQSRQNKEPVIQFEEVKVDLAMRLLMLVHSNAISADVHRVKQ